ncbi:MAG: molybdate ABC transporter substrate-binding protein [Zwartia sp.]
MSILKILSGGAAASAVKGIQTAFETDNRCALEGAFSAVGEMRDALLRGDPCDVVILTRAIIEQLITSGHVRAGSARSLGKVQTGIAVKQREPTPKVDSPAALAKAFRQAKAIYCPDTKKSTAGIHFMRVLTELGLEQEVKAKLREFANGATAMKEMAQCSESNLIGCTQATEINYTDGVVLVANLPKEFELATDYTLGVCTQTTQPALAQILADWLTGAQSEQVRRQGGFEF